MSISKRYLSSNWYFGAVYCVVNNFVAYLTVAASVFTLMAITLDRWVWYFWSQAISNSTQFGHDTFSNIKYVHSLSKNTEE